MFIGTPIMHYNNVNHTLYTWLDNTQAQQNITYCMKTEDQDQHVRLHLHWVQVDANKVAD